MPQSRYIDQILDIIYDIYAQNPREYARKGVSYQKIYRTMDIKHERSNIRHIKKVLSKGVEVGHLVQFKLSFKLSDQMKKKISSERNK